MTEQLQISKLFSPTYGSKRVEKSNNEPHSFDRANLKRQTREDKPESIYIKDSSIEANYERRPGLASIDQTLVSPKGFG